MKQFIIATTSILILFTSCVQEEKTIIIGFKPNSHAGAEGNSGNSGAGASGSGSSSGSTQQMSHTFNTLRYLDLVFDGTVINWNNVNSVTIESDSQRSSLQINSTQAANLSSVKFLISSTDQNLNLSLTDTSGATTQQTVVITSETINL